MELFLRFIILQGFFLYIPALSLTIANTYVFPILHNPNADQKIIKGKVYHGNTDIEPLRAMVTGVTNPIVDYPNRTELVRGAAFERFKNFLQPAHSSRQVDSSMQSPRGSGNRGGETVRTNAAYSFSPGEDAAGDTIDDVPIGDKKEATEREEVKIKTIEEETEEELKEEEEIKHKEKEESTQNEHLEREIQNDDALQHLDPVEIDFASVLTEDTEEKKDLLIVSTDEEESLHPSPIDQDQYSS